MNNIIENDTIDFLKKKYNTLNELLRVTNLVKLTGDDDKYEKEAQDYIFLIEKRENIFNDIEKINDELISISQKNRNKPKENGDSVDIRVLENEIRDLVLKIIEIDNKNITTANFIFSKLKDSIKNIKMGRNINSAYQNDYGMLIGGLIDKSN